MPGMLSGASYAFNQAKSISSALFQLHIYHWMDKYTDFFHRSSGLWEEAIGGLLTLPGLSLVPSTALQKALQWHQGWGQ